MNETALRTSSGNYPIDKPRCIKLSLTFTNEQFRKLTKGLIPRQMEDKWFVFYENDWLYFHRSSTGYGVYKVYVFKDGEGYKINEFWVERNQEKYGNEDDDKDIGRFLFLLAEGLLGIDVRILCPNGNTYTETNALADWGTFGSLFINQGKKSFTKLELDYFSGIKSMLFGVAVGDALGVPVEFKSRETIRQNPVKDMIGYGTYNLPPGTFSDDSSLTFCLAEALTQGFDIKKIGVNFVKWLDQDYWTARGVVFDVGNTTMEAINRIAKGVRPDLAGGADISSNGNGSLMRILPLLFYLWKEPIEQRFEITKQVSSITHRHSHSVISCFYYLEFARGLFLKRNKLEIYENLKIEITDFLLSQSIDSNDVGLFDRLLKQDIHELSEENIFSSGYVLHTLEASIWCLLTTNNYSDAVLKQ